VFVGANGDLRALGGGMLFMFAISVLPPALAAYAIARRRYVDALEAALATVTVIATASWGMRRAGFPRRLALLQPLGTALFAAIAANSSARVLSGRGVEWRGRTYHASSGKAPRASEPNPAG